VNSNWLPLFFLEITLLIEKVIITDQSTVRVVIKKEEGENLKIES
jgi:hypothetical protein